MTLPKITLLPVLPGDFLSLSRLEAYVFRDEEFSTVAFGPLRNSERNIQVRANGMARTPSNPNRRDMYIKAVLQGPDGSEEMIGAAGWSFVTGREEESREADEGKLEETPREEELSADEKRKKDDEIWGPGANVKFCVDAFCVADEHMLRSTEGKDYAKLSTLVVSPEYQRRGIGTMLLDQGLKEVDERQLQCVLAASPEGEPLYERYGFKLFELMPMKLWEYEGGEGFGVARHVVMHRPAQMERIE